MTPVKRSVRGVAKGLLRDRFVKKKVLPYTRTKQVPSDGKTAAPDRNLVGSLPGPLQDKEYPTVGQTFQQLINVMSKACDIVEEMGAEQTELRKENTSLVNAVMEEAASLQRQMVELSQPY